MAQPVTVSDILMMHSWRCIIVVEGILLANSRTAWQLSYNHYILRVDIKFKFDPSQPSSYNHHYHVWHSWIVRSTCRVYFCDIHGYPDKQWWFPPHITTWSVFITKAECLLRGTKWIFTIQVHFCPYKGLIKIYVYLLLFRKPEWKRVPRVLGKMER